MFPLAVMCPFSITKSAGIVEVPALNAILLSVNLIAVSVSFCEKISYDFYII